MVGDQNLIHGGGEHISEHLNKTFLKKAKNTCKHPEDDDAIAEALQLDNTTPPSFATPHT